MFDHKKYILLVCVSQREADYSLYILEDMSSKDKNVLNEYVQCEIVYIRFSPFVDMKKKSKVRTYCLIIFFIFLVGWSLTALSTQFTPYRTFKVELYYTY